MRGISGEKFCGIPWSWSVKEGSPSSLLPPISHGRTTILISSTHQVGSGKETFSNRKSNVIFLLF